MAAPFGFSAGDFIAAIGLIRDVTRALRDSGGASEECRELIYELHGLETALLEVKALDLEVDQRAQRVALRHAATQCQNTVDNFLGGLRKYQACLTNGYGSSRWKTALRKIQWQLCKKEDLVKFRAEIGFHAQSIQMLMLSMQV
jgi:hypothetical protein